MALGLVLLAVALVINAAVHGAAIWRPSES
jgi:hypothetical protein